MEVDIGPSHGRCTELRRASSFTRHQPHIMPANPLRRILLTGVNGQLGSELLSKLSPLGLVIATSRQELDLADPAAVLAQLDRHRPQLIVNAAAYTAVDRAESEPDLAQRINAVAPQCLAEYAVAHGAAIMHFSTDYVFDGSANQPYTPDAPTNPINIYGSTKLAGERAIASSGAKHIIIRTSWVYAMTGRNFVRAILNQAEQGKPLRVVNDQHGSPTWAQDLAVGSAAIAARLLRDDNWRSGIYHLTGSGITTWYDFACAIIDASAIRPKPTITAVPSTEFPTKAKRPMFSALNCSATEHDFGVTLPHWRDAIMRAMRSAEHSG